MKKKHEELFALSFAVTFPIVMGFVVAVRMYIDGIGRTSLVLLGVWMAATCFLWTLPRVLQRLGVMKEVVTDERDVLVYANSALVAHAATWLFFISSAILACWSVGDSGTVAVSVLPVAVVWGAVVFQVVFAFSGYVQEKTRLWPVKS
jgi:hypothetical protein